MNASILGRFATNALLMHDNCKKLSRAIIPRRFLQQDKRTWKFQNNPSSFTYTQKHTVSAMLLIVELGSAIVFVHPIHARWRKIYTNANGTRL